MKPARRAVLQVNSTVSDPFFFLVKRQTRRHQIQVAQVLRERLQQMDRTSDLQVVTVIRTVIPRVLAKARPWKSPRWQMRRYGVESGAIRKAG